MNEEHREEAGSYETAISRLDEIIGRLDSGDAQLRETLDLCAEAKGLIEYCAGELAAVDQGLKELRLEDLARSLSATPEPGPGPGPGSETGAEPGPGTEAESGPEPA